MIEIPSEVLRRCHLNLGRFTGKNLEAANRMAFYAHFLESRIEEGLKLLK
jgi:hypothetical protein